MNVFEIFFFFPIYSVSLEFSTSHGRSWSLLHTECLPELCAGSHLPHSSIYSSENYSGSVAQQYFIKIIRS